jgi:REP element-mobilizing transposase RayT
MSHDPQRHHRRSIRLKGYDYTQAGAYFITLCVQDRECLFGDVVNGEMQLSEAGQIAADTWTWLATQYAYADLDAWVIMPNHMHGILVIHDDDDVVVVGGGGRGGSRTAPTMQTAPATTLPKRKPLGRLIGAYKTVSTKHINLLRNTTGAIIWQRNYYEHIIRNEASYQRIRDYMVDNPAQWELDLLHPHSQNN